MFRSRRRRPKSAVHKTLTVANSTTVADGAASITISKSSATATNGHKPSRAHVQSALRRVCRDIHSCDQICNLLLMLWGMSTRAHNGPHVTNLERAVGHVLNFLYNWLRCHDVENWQPLRNDWSRAGIFSMIRTRNGNATVTYCLWYASFLKTMSECAEATWLHSVRFIFFLNKFRGAKFISVCSKNDIKN